MATSDGPLGRVVSALLADEAHGFTRVLAFSNSATQMKRLRTVLPKALPMSVLTSQPRVHTILSGIGISVRLLDDSLTAHELGVLALVRDFVLQALGEGDIGIDERLLTVLAEPVFGHLVIEPANLGLQRLQSMAQRHGIELAVINRVLELARRLGSRGRENKPVGGLFIIGSLPSLRKHSTALVLNPFKGHPVDRRSILDERNLETLQEFSCLDGALLFNRKGVAADAGRYVQVPAGVSASSGEGGRHLAARAITQIVDCVAVALSSSGVVTVYSEGRKEYRVRLN